MAYTAAVITVSDKGFRGERKDESGPALQAFLEKEGYRVLYTALVPDEREAIQKKILHCTDALAVSLVLTTGGTGFSPRDITPEASAALIERPCPGISELMRQKSLAITERACLSRGLSGIRKNSLILNLPGSPRGAVENLAAVISPLAHGLAMLASSGSADCARDFSYKQAPSLDVWMEEAGRAENAEKVGMYLSHRGVVRKSPRAEVRRGEEGLSPVKALRFSYDPQKAEQAVRDTESMEGIFFVKVWLNEGILPVGTPIMQVLVGGDIRPRVIAALESLVERLKRDCVTEEEIRE